MTAYSPLLRIAELVPFDPATVNSWGSVLTASVPLYEQGACGWTTVAIGGLTAYTLTTANNAPDQARFSMQVYTGALTGDCTVTVPNVQRLGRVQNLTTGGHNVIISAGAGTKAVIPPNQFVYDVQLDGAGDVAVMPIGAGQFVAGTISVTTVNATTVNATTVNATTVNATTVNTTNATVNGPATINGPLDVNNAASTFTNGTTGSDTIALFQNHLGGQALVLSGNGAVNIPAITSFTTGSAANLAVVGSVISLSVSSARYKRDIQPFPEPLAAVRKLRAVRFRSRAENDGDTVFAGMIAEDVHDAGLTEFVRYDDQGRPDAVHYGPLAALAIGAVSELADIVDVLRQRVAALEAGR